MRAKLISPGEGMVHPLGSCWGGTLPGGGGFCYSIGDTPSGGKCLFGLN